MNRLFQVAGAIGMLLAAQGQGPARPEVPESLESAGRRGSDSGGTRVRSANLCLPSRSRPKVCLGVEGSRSGSDGRDREEDCASFCRANLEACRRKRSERQSNRQAGRAKAGGNPVVVAECYRSQRRRDSQPCHEHPANPYRGWPATECKYLRCVRERQRVEEPPTRPIIISMRLSTEASPLTLRVRLGKKGAWATGSGRITRSHDSAAILLE